MKKINKILILFMAICFITLYGSWVFIHSEEFSKVASKKVSDLLTKKIKAKLTFEKIEFGMFPPTTIFKNVHLFKDVIGKESIDISVEEFGVYFTYASFISSNLEIDELKIKNGKVKVFTDPNDKTPDIDWKNLKLIKIFTEYQKIQSIIPFGLNIVKLENIFFEIDKSKLQLRNASLLPHQKNFRLKLNIDDVWFDHEIKNLKINKIKNITCQADLGKNLWTIDYLKLRDEKSVLEFNGKILQLKNDNQLELKLSIASSFEYLNSYWTIPSEDLKMIKGSFKSTSMINGNVFRPDIVSRIDISNLESPFVNLKNASVEIVKQKESINVNKLFATNNNEKYRLVNPAKLFDLSKMSFYKSRGVFEIENAFTNTFLHVTQKALEPFKGYITGRVEVAFDGEKVFFVINDKVALSSFKLLLPKSEKPLLVNSGFEISNSIITLDKDSNVGIDSIISMKDTKLKINGLIGKDQIEIFVKDSNISLGALGPISGIQLNGTGPIELKVSGPMNDVRFNFNVFWKKFSLLDINLGDVKAAFTLSLSDVLLSVETLEGTFNNTVYTGNGWLKFGDGSGLDLKMSFPETTFFDAQKMYGLVFKNLKIPADLGLRFEAGYRVSGSFGLDELKIDGSLKGRELHVYGEDIESTAFNFFLVNKNLSIKNLKAKKGRGEISGDANISLINNFTEVEAIGNGLRLSDFNFYKKLKLAYDSDINLEFDGNGTGDTFSSRLKFKTTNPFIGGYSASNSSGLIYLGNDEIISKINLLGSKIKIDSIQNLNTNQVVLKSVIETQDIKEILGAVSAHNMNDKQISGQVRATLNTKFNASTLDLSKFNLELKQFKLKRDEVDLKVDSARNSVVIEDGIVKKWDLYFVDGKNFFSSKGANSLNGKGIILDQVFNIKSSIFEMLNGAIEKSKGVIKGFSQLTINSGLSFTGFRVSSSDASLKIKNVPGLVTSLNYEIVKNANRFEISKFSAKYGDGEFKANGFFMFENIFPTINLDFKIDKSTIPLFKKSNIVLASTGVITGTSPPYKLIGKASVLQGEIFDDPSDIMNENTVSLDEFNKYLPLKNDNSKNEFLDINIAFDTKNSVIVKNNSAEVFLKAQGQLNGSMLSPEINTRIDVLPVSSKFKFKGHEFILSQGYVEIHDKDKNRNSDLKFVGSARISDYDIKLDISGKLDKLAINLSSDPVRGQEDILSLLTLGVTSDMNKNLDAGERSAITRLGIGTIFLDRLKVNEDLNSSIGINLSVAPEFQEDESSLISGGKSGVSDASTNRLKSSTKIKLDKKLSPKVNVSVSSTVGGTIEQKQEMNINWNMNKNMSIEGVYEIKPSTDENTSTPNSLGADLKFKWSY